MFVDYYHSFRPEIENNKLSILMNSADMFPTLPVPTKKWLSQNERKVANKGVEF